MPLYFFRISQGRYSGVSDHPSEFADRDAAWTEMKSVCANLLGGITRCLKQDAQWHMELLDETRKPVFRIRLVGETLDEAACAASSSRVGRLRAPPDHDGCDETAGGIAGRGRNRMR